MTLGLPGGGKSPPGARPRSVLTSAISLGVLSLLMVWAVAACGSGSSRPPVAQSPTTTGSPATTTGSPATGASTPGSTGAGSTGAGNLSIKVAGRTLVDASNHTVYLRGVNRSGTEYACIQGHGIFDGPSDAASVEAIASWHVNVVRIPLNEDCWLGINGVNPAYGGNNYRQAIIDYVNLLNQHGLYAILELHWSAPGTTVAAAQMPMPDQSHSPAFWTSVAATFKSNAAVMFDLFNEPYPGNNADTTAAWTCWASGGTCPGLPYPVAGMQELLNSVRSTGAKNVVMLGGIQYANTLDHWSTYAPHDPDGQLVASFHNYNSEICTNVQCWNSTLTSIGNVPLVTGEIGETDGQATYIDMYTTWAVANGVSYLAWTWDTWGCGNNAVLISDYSGTPCPGYGAGYQQQLAHPGA